MCAPHRHTNLYCALYKIRIWFYSRVADAAINNHSLWCVLTKVCSHSARNAQYVFVYLCGACTEHDFSFVHTHTHTQTHTHSLHMLTAHAQYHMLTSTFKLPDTPHQLEWLFHEVHQRNLTREL